MITQFWTVNELQAIAAAVPHSHIGDVLQQPLRNDNIVDARGMAKRTVESSAAPSAEVCVGSCQMMRVQEIPQLRAIVILCLSSPWADGGIMVWSKKCPRPSPNLCKPIRPLASRCKKRGQLVVGWHLWAPRARNQR